MMTKMDPQSTQLTAKASKSLLPTESIFPLLDLPAEIRQIIYRGLLVNNFNGDEGRLWFSRWSVTHPYEICGQLLRVCRLIHKEAAPILYGENEFCTHLEPYRFGKEVVGHVGTAYVSMIRKLRFVSSVFWFCRNTYRVPEMLNDHSALRGLQVVTITKIGYHQEINTWPVRDWATFHAVPIVKETHLKVLVEEEPVEQPMYWSTSPFDKNRGGEARTMRVMAPNKAGIGPQVSSFLANKVLPHLMSRLVGQNSRCRSRMGHNPQAALPCPRYRSRRDLEKW